MTQAILKYSLYLLLTTPMLCQSGVEPCSKPAVLRITMKGSDAYYQLDHHRKHKLFSLGEVAAAATSCSPDRMIFVVTDYDVPLRLVQLPGKEQITRVCYFVQGSDGVVHELLFGPFYKALPLTPNITPIPDDEDAPPPTVVAKGNK